MRKRRLYAPRIDFGPLRRELRLPSGYPEAAVREAEVAAAGTAAADRTDIPFVTVDPPTSRDLDQALCLRPRGGGGYRLYYAIADVTPFIPVGGALEAETWRRGQTVYLPDGKVPLHPAVVGEGTASLLPDQTRPAVLWTIDLDADAATEAVRVERVTVRSRAKLDYAAVQSAADQGRAPEPLALLPAVGRLLVARGLARGAINLPIPEQEVEPAGEGWRLTLRAQPPVEEYNAQLSLLTGMSAAQIMLDGGVGLLRTMPRPAAEAVSRLRAAASALGIEWPDGAGAGAVIAGLDAGHPRAAALLDQAMEMLRGAGYTAFDGSPPDQVEHGAVAAPYAHVTAPLRRLADRYATEVCLALYEGREVPERVRQALPKLPGVMSATGRLAGAAERGAVDLAEAVLLARRVDEEFSAGVLDVDGSHPDRAPGGTIALDEPPVRARCEGAGLPLGERIRVRLAEADPARRRVLFHAV